MGQLTSLPPSIQNDEFSSGTGAANSSVDDCYNFGVKAHELARDFINYKLHPERGLPRDLTSRTLCRVGDELAGSYGLVMNAMIKRVKYSHLPENDVNKNYNSDLQKFKVIAEGISKEGKENWGRIVALFLAGSLIAQSKAEQEDDPDVEELIRVVGDYISIEKRPWIEKHGGWANFVRFFNPVSRERIQ